MTMKSIILTLLIFCGQLAFSQNEKDLIRYSRNLNNGTARSAAMGGAFGALGGDLSSISANPAGIGVFRRSEISFTPLLNVTSTKSGATNTRKTAFQLGSIGGVISWGNGHFDWRGINFGFNYTNLSNFNRKSNQFIYGSPTNFSQVWASEANWAHASEAPALPYLSQMAEETGLIYYTQADSSYHTVLNDRDATDQYKLIKEEGYQGEYDFSIGTNYKDKLYLGLAVGIQSVRYRFRSSYQETPSQASASTLEGYIHDVEVRTDGVGTNVSFGIIYRPVPALRLGLAIHTPTYFSFSEDYGESLLSQFTPDPEGGNNIYQSWLPETSYDYDMQTPWKALFSIATVIGKKAILSMDYEFHNYHSAEFSDAGSGYDYNAPGEINETIRTLLQNTHNFRLGAEYRINSICSLRAGYSYWDSPYRNTDCAKIQTLAGGFGLNFGYFYCDAAYSYRFAEDSTRFYQYTDPEDSQWDISAEPVHNKYRGHSLQITVGARF